ncbi:hypothetical protein C1H46_027351 [Malus baccata]|uniref:Uncharacterized protein n=1 Tax=Malus baccata TaxID=106549 RepID=A0A540LKR9_MALBA|nr:hypothetical protein C1H46_027351 [Malus baccata]
MKINGRMRPFVFSFTGAAAIEGLKGWGSKEGLTERRALGEEERRIEIQED